MCTKIDTFNFFFLPPPLSFFCIILFLSQLFAVPVFLCPICLFQTNPNPKLSSGLSIFTCDYPKFSSSLLTSSPPRLYVLYSIPHSGKRSRLCCNKLFQVLGPGSCAQYFLGQVFSIRHNMQSVPLHWSASELLYLTAPCQDLQHNFLLTGKGRQKKKKTKKKPAKSPVHLLT